jgi:hypothetical protein
LLLQGDRGRQTFNGVHVWCADLFDQAPGIGRHRFEIAPLCLGIERTERQRRFARARYAGKYDQRIARDLDIDIL